MIVDDDAEFAELLRQGIRAAGYRAIWARDGREALSAITDQKPDLLLIDLGMPGMAGAALMARIDRSPALARIPRAVFTGDSDAAPSARGWPTLRKPIYLDRLLRVMRGLLVRRPPTVFDRR